MKPKVLIIDDNLSILELLVAYLADDDYDVTTSISGVEGAQLVEELHPDLIVLDIMMPDKAGSIIALELEVSHPEIPIIVVTALDRNSDTFHTRIKNRKNVSAFLNKPIRKRDFISAVGRALIFHD